MHVILRGHFVSYNIHHVHIPGGRGRNTEAKNIGWTDNNNNSRRRRRRSLDKVDFFSLVLYSMG